MRLIIIFKVLKVFLKLKNPKKLSLLDKKTKKNSKKPKKPKKITGLGFFKKPGFFPTLPGEAEPVRVRQEVDAGREKAALQPGHQLQHLRGVAA